MPKLFIDRILCSDKGSLDPFQKSFSQLLNGHTKSVGLEKLKNTDSYPVYSIRLSNEARALLTVSSIGDKKQWVLLDILEHHEYEKASTLQKGGLVAFLSKNEHWMSKEVHSFSAEDFEPVESSPITATDATEECHFVSAHRIQGRYIELSDEQNQIDTLELPAGIVAIAGSGKTLVSEVFSQQNMLNISATESLPVLYLAPNRHLASYVQQSSQERFAGMQVNAMEFKTYSDLMDEKNTEEEEYPHFLNWLASYKKMQQVTGGLESRCHDKARDVFYEFRLVGGYSDLEEYKQCGDKQSNMTVEERTWVWDAYSNYTKYLKDHSLNFAAHTKLGKKNAYSLVIIDEAQSLSFLQLNALILLAQDHQVLFLLDPNQSLDNLGSTSDYLKTYFHRQQLSFNKLLLTRTYRSPDDVLGLANQVLNIRNQILKGTIDKEINEVVPNGKAGQLFWTQEANQVVRAKANQAGTVVITSEEYINEARELYQTDMVFTPGNYGGMESQVVIVHRPLDRPEFNAIASLLTRIEEQVSFFNRPKQHSDEVQRAQVRALHALFVGLTRTLNQAIVVQKKEGRQHALFAWLSALEENSENKNILLDTSDTIEWEEVIQKALRQGLEKQARAQMKRLGWSEEKQLAIISDGHIRSEKPTNIEPVKEETHALADEGAKPQKKKKSKGVKHAKQGKSKSVKPKAVASRHPEIDALLKNFPKEWMNFVKLKNAPQLLDTVREGSAVFWIIINEPQYRKRFLELFDNYGNNRSYITELCLKKLPLQEKAFSIPWLSLRHQFNTGYASGLGAAVFHYLANNPQLLVDAPDLQKSFSPTCFEELTLFIKKINDQNRHVLFPSLYKFLTTSFKVSQSDKYKNVLTGLIGDASICGLLAEHLKEEQHASPILLRLFSYVEIKKLIKYPSFISLLTQHPDVVFCKSFLDTLDMNLFIDVISKMETLPLDVIKTYLLEQEGVIEHLFYSSQGLILLRLLCDKQPETKAILRDCINKFPEKEFYLSGQRILKQYLNEEAFPDFDYKLDFKPKNPALFSGTKQEELQRYQRMCNLMMGRLIKALPTLARAQPEDEVLLKQLATYLVRLWFSPKKFSGDIVWRAYNLSAQLIINEKIMERLISVEFIVTALDKDDELEKGYLVINRDTTRSLDEVSEWGFNVRIVDLSNCRTGRLFDFAAELKGKKHIYLQHPAIVESIFDTVNESNASRIHGYMYYLLPEFYCIIIELLEGTFKEESLENSTSGFFASRAAQQINLHEASWGMRP